MMEKTDETIPSREELAVYIGVSPTFCTKVTLR